MVHFGMVGIVQSADSAGARPLAELPAFDTLMLSAFLVVLTILLVLTVWMIVQMGREMREGDSPRIESHWGGIGGGLGGWQISRSLAYLLALVTFASLFTLTFKSGIAEFRAAATREPAARLVQEEGAGAARSDGETPVSGADAGEAADTTGAPADTAAAEG